MAEGLRSIVLGACEPGPSAIPPTQRRATMVTNAELILHLTAFTIGILFGLWITRR